MFFEFFILFLQIPSFFSQTCECIPSPNACLGYDSRMQADSIEEAMASFPDLSLDGVDAKMSNDVNCNTKECQDCQKDIRKQLKKIGLLAPDISDIMGIQANDTSSCTKYRFSLEKQKEEAEEKHEEDDDDSDSDSDEDEKKKKNKHKRDKRQVGSNSITSDLTNDTMIGTRFTVSCSTKGISMDPTGTVSLCSSCWVWRKLPDNYRPQYINELVCDTADDSCLSGYATCTVGHRTFDAVRTENGASTTVTLTAGSYCECRISKGSSLESLVTGTGISGSFTPVPHTA